MSQASHRFALPALIIKVCSNSLSVCSHSLSGFLSRFLSHFQPLSLSLSLLLLHIFSIFCFPSALSFIATVLNVKHFSLFITFSTFPSLMSDSFLRLRLSFTTACFRSLVSQSVCCPHLLLQKPLSKKTDERKQNN